MSCAFVKKKVRAIAQNTKSEFHANERGVPRRKKARQRYLSGEGESKSEGVDAKSLLVDLEKFGSTLSLARPEIGEEVAR